MPSCQGAIGEDQAAQMPRELLAPADRPSLVETEADDRRRRQAETRGGTEPGMVDLTAFAADRKERNCSRGGWRAAATAHVSRVWWDHDALLGRE